MDALRLSTAYLAPVSWYAAAARAGRVVVEQHEHYVKQTCRNRCRIAMPDGAVDLVVPVEAASSHAAIADIRISEHGNWRHHHWSALRTAYGKSPFFEYYADDFEPLYARRQTFLVDFNEALQQIVCRLMDLDVAFVRSESYAPPVAFEDLPAMQKPYYQVFSPRNGFLPDLSIVDLLFNLGPESLLYLTREG